jgi:hypothetical protein
MLGSKLHFATLVCLVATVCAFTSKCLLARSTPTDGLCKGMSFSSKACTSESMEMQGISMGDYIQKYLSGIDQSKCLDPKVADPEYFLLRGGGSGDTCAKIGGTVNPDFCKQGGGRCKMVLRSDMCQSDADCALDVNGRSPASSRMQCCSSVSNMAMLICSNVSTALLNQEISNLRTQPVEQKGCRDTDCWSTGSSGTSSAVFTSPFYSVLVLVPVTGLLAIASSIRGGP